MASNDVEILDPAAPVEKAKESNSSHELDRRHFFAALGVAGVAAAAGAALVSSKSAGAQQPSNPNGFAQVDVINLMLNIKYLKATLYSYITQGVDLPGSSFVTVGTGGVFNAPGQITFSNQQITDLFNEMYYDELNQLIALRAIQGVAVSPRQTMNLLGTGTTSTTTTTMTQSQAIALARLLEDLSASAFATATDYLTGATLNLAAQALATDGLHAGAIRLLAIQNGVQYQGTQFASVATSNIAQTAVSFTGATITGNSLIYALLPANVPVVGTVITGIGIPPGSGAVIAAVLTAPNAVPTAITTKGSNILTNVSSVTGLVVGQPLTGANIPAGAYISALGTKTITFAPSATGATGSTTVSPSGFVTSGSATITGVSSVAGLIVGQVITGAGITPGTTITAISSSAFTITMSAPATATSVVSIAGVTTAGSPNITGLSSVIGLSKGGTISGPGIPAKTTIVSLTSNAIALSANATISSSTPTSFSGIVTLASNIVTLVSSVTGLAIGQFITGAGIPAGATITAIGASTVTMSVPATATNVVTPSALTTTGSNTLNAVSSVAGLIIGQPITGVGIPAGAIITAIGTSTVTMSVNATATIASSETVTSPTPETLYGGGVQITSPLVETLNSPTTAVYTAGLTQITITAPATATGASTYYTVLPDNQDVEPGDPGTAALSATGPTAVGGTNPAIYQGFFNTAGAGTSGSTSTPPGFAFARTFPQVLAVLYGYNPTNSLISTSNYQGGFYPVGVSGPINSTI